MCSPGCVPAVTNYFSKPYDMDELLLRVEALLRRGKLIGQKNRLAFGNLVFDFISHRALLCGRDILLRPKEFALLCTLAASPVKRSPAAEQYHMVWGMDMAGDARTVKEHIYLASEASWERNAGLSIVSERKKAIAFSL